MQGMARAVVAGLWLAVAAATAGAAQDGAAAGAGAGAWAGPGAGAGSGSAATAGRGPVVVELFTAQGCASCPPADALLAELATRADVLPLALHVDYWDYLGWEDRFAQPAFTARQKAYAHGAGRRMVYTPQMIVGGHLEVAGYKPDKVFSAISLEKERPAVVRIELGQTTPGTLHVRLTRTGPAGGPAQVIAVRFRPAAEVHVERGENAGRRMRYVNIVTDWTVLGLWDGSAPAEFTLQRPEGPDRLPGAVLVQEEGPGPVLSAARFD